MTDTVASEPSKSPSPEGNPADRMCAAVAPYRDGLAPNDGHERRAAPENSLAAGGWRSRLMDPTTDRTHRPALTPYR